MNFQEKKKHSIRLYKIIFVCCLEYFLSVHNFLCFFLQFLSIYNNVQFELIGLI